MVAVIKRISGLIDGNAAALEELERKVACSSGPLVKDAAQPDWVGASAMNCEHGVRMRPTRKKKSTRRR